MMPIFDKPGYVLNEVVKNSYNLKGVSTHGYGLEKFAQEQKVHTLSFSRQLFGMNFPRFLAKIAYGMVVQEFGLNKIKEAYVIPCILGKNDDAGQWVGCEEPEKSPALLPREQLFHKVEVLSENGLLGAKIRLFATYQTPQYLVIVGRLKENQ
jgi:hypothetical protein